VGHKGVLARGKSRYLVYTWGNLLYVTILRNCDSIERRFLKYGRMESMSETIGTVKDQVKGRNRVDVDVNLDTIATSNGDRCGIVRLSCVLVVGGGKSDVESSVHSGNPSAWLGRDGMHGIPWLGGRCHEIGASIERRYLIDA